MPAERPRDAIDCDVHCAPESMDVLLPHLGDYWRSYVEDSTARLPPSGAYPPGAPTSGTEPVPRSYDELAGVLERTAPRRALLSCLTLDGVHRNPYYAAAMARGLNDWMRDEFLVRDERLRGSIVVSTLDIVTAVEEVERLGEDPRFAQDLLPVRSDVPYGNALYHPLYEAAVPTGCGSPCTRGAAGTAATTTGLTTTYLEDYASNAHIAQFQLLSLVAEGVFGKYPDLGVVLQECGFSWLPPLLWRVDKDWKGVWREVPWVKERPSAYVRRHVRLTREPAQLRACPSRSRRSWRPWGRRCCCTPATTRTTTATAAARCCASSARTTWRRSCGQRDRVLRAVAVVRLVVARVEDFPPGERRIVKAGARSIGVFRIDDRFFALRNRCPHQGGPLCHGRLSPWAVADLPGQVEMQGPPLVACPWHGWEYDLETGQSFLGPGETRVKAYDASVARGDTLEDIPAAARAAGRSPGPYVAETFPVYVDEDYVVVDV